MGADEPATEKQKRNDNQRKVPDPETDPASSRAASLAPGKVPTTKPALSEIIDPTTKPAFSPPISVTVPSLPSTPEEILNCDVQKLMRSVLPWCRVALVQRLSTDEAFKFQFVASQFWRERPLQIAALSHDTT